MLEKSYLRHRCQAKASPKGGRVLGSYQTLETKRAVSLSGLYSQSPLCTLRVFAPLEAPESIWRKIHYTTILQILRNDNRYEYFIRAIPWISLISRTSMDSNLFAMQS